MKIYFPFSIKLCISLIWKINLLAFIKIKTYQKGLNETCKKIFASKQTYMVCIVNFEISHINSYIWLIHRLIIKIVDNFKNMRVFLKCSVEYLGIFLYLECFYFNLTLIAYHIIKALFLNSLVAWFHSNDCKFLFSVVYHWCMHRSFKWTVSID